MATLITQSALDALKRDGFGILYCPQGNYGMMKQFPEYCNFPDGCIFGANTIFGEGCSFGEWTSFGKHCHFGAECTFGVSCAFNEGCVFDEWCHFGEKNRFVGRSYFGADCKFEHGCSTSVFIKLPPPEPKPPKKSQPHMFLVGDKVRFNGNWNVPSELQGITPVVASAPYLFCGMICVDLQGWTGSYPCDGLEQI